MTAAPRKLVVVMGVSGTGKSTLAAGLSKMLRLPWLDGDDEHSPEAVAKMCDGTPLSDEDRWPWLDRIGARLADDEAAPAGLVVACSALKRAYRDRLRASAPGLRFVHLHGEPALIAARLRERAGHYMSAALLDSQLQALQWPMADEADVLSQDIDAALEQIMANVARSLGGAWTAKATQR